MYILLYSWASTPVSGAYHTCATTIYYQTAHLYLTKETRDPKFDPCFLQLSDLTNVVRQWDKYQYSMNVQAQKYKERKSNFEVAKWWL